MCALEPVFFPCTFSPLETHHAELQPRGRLEVMGGQGGVEGSRTGPLPRLARLTEAISGVLDDYTMVRTSLSLTTTLESDLFLAVG